jgi:hypothetical protein
MKRFIQRFSERITGVLSGFDRLVFRGTLRYIAVPSGMMDFLKRENVLLKEFGHYAKDVSERLKESLYAEVRRSGRPIIYLQSGQTNKEEVALEIAKNDRIDRGLIAVITCTEPCKSYDIYRNKEKKQIELVMRTRKCLYLYLYFFDHEFGFMNARIQSWLPFNIQICMNGRERLARKLDFAGIRYRRRDNCFTWLADPEKAQKLMDRQLKISWPKVLNQIARMLNPAHQQIFRQTPIQYYWSIYQSEWATDLMFKSSLSLAEIYPHLLLHGITHFSSGDVMRFLGRKVHGAYRGEIISDFKDRPEGVRIKHHLGKNSVKLYDKQGSVLRVETTINKPRDIKVYRPKENDPSGECSWRYLRQGIADLYRRAEFSQSCNERYLDALAQIDTSTPVASALQQISKPTTWNGKRIRALRLWSDLDMTLLKTVYRGEFFISGFRNKDLKPFLFKSAATTTLENRRHAAKISRLIRLLRAHHIVRRIPSTYRYRLTEKGKEILNALFSLEKLTLAQINNLAA